MIAWYSRYRENHSYLSYHKSLSTVQPQLWSVFLCKRIISWGNKCKLLTNGLPEMSTHLDTVVVLFPLMMGKPGGLKSGTSGFACFGSLTTNCIYFTFLSTLFQSIPQVSRIYFLPARQPLVSVNLNIPKTQFALDRQSITANNLLLFLWKSKKCYRTW